MSELKALPELEPRAELEPVVLAAMSRAAATGQSRSYWRYLARVAALGVAIGAGALLAMWAADFEEPSERTPVAEETDAAYFDLVEQTAQLEQLLALMPAPRRAMRAGTASTIVGLEDRIALIDAVLESPDAAEPEYREALMRDRVEIMNALVNVRYAQSRAFVF
ncbi:MAG TPA: hypothetical protein VMR74_03430 [Gammaproteobacteria bacterium]|nr:hypothetical protein [Gammaproteobacteria bacterium]